MMKYYLTATFLFLLSNFSHGQQATWKDTINNASKSVVSIKVDMLRSFDTISSGLSQATGFIVDADRGIILTNRHVVTQAPISARAVFSNSEEIDLIPIYRDPVHDFGFFKYDPQALRFLKPDGLKMNAESAKIGDEIRLIGNDGGEHMSILSGTLARLDRNAPKYRRGGYQDFNTFYFQSSANSSGGSSGSPIINKNGEVIALNAGGSSRTASSLFFPLYKVVDALAKIQKNLPINRGTLQTTFEYQTFDQGRRLGMTLSIEEAFRNGNSNNGLLVVTTVTPNGPAHNRLRAGDILMSFGSKDEDYPLVTRFEELEFFLDSHVDKEISVSVLRRGKRITETLTVQDLFDISPNEYISVSGGVFNNFSYQIARQFNAQPKGVFVAKKGFIFNDTRLARKSVIRGINGKKIENLDDFYSALKTLKQNEHFTLKYTNVYWPKVERVISATFQTGFHTSERCKLARAEGQWRCHDLIFQKEAADNRLASEIRFEKYKKSPLKRLAPSLVKIETKLPYIVDGLPSDILTGTGLVLDADNGLILTDKNTVPARISQVSIGIAGQVNIDAEIVYIHPTHSYVFIRYNPDLLKGTKLKSAKLSDTPLNEGDTIHLTGYAGDNRLLSEPLVVSSFDPIYLPSSYIPTFRETNLSVLNITNPPIVHSAAITDKRGTVRGWWTNFPNYNRKAKGSIDVGLPLDHVIDMRDQWLRSGSIKTYSMETEFAPVALADARKLGLNEYWLTQLQDTNDRPQALKVVARSAVSDAYKKLKEGDILLTINDQLIRSFSDLGKAVRGAELGIQVWREKEVLSLRIKTEQLNDLETTDIYSWAGAILQNPHRALAMQRGLNHGGVFVNRIERGSPIQRARAKLPYSIVEFEGEKIRDLHHFIALSTQYRDAKYVNLRARDIVGREHVLSVKQNLSFWPSKHIFEENKVWKLSIKQ